MRSISEQLISLANRLADSSLFSQAELVLAQALQIEQITDVGIITPDHPWYGTLYNVLRPGEAINEKLADFSARLKVED